MFKPDVHTALLLLLVTALALPWQELPVIVVVGSLVIGGVLMNTQLRVAAKVAIRRMRWLLLSLLVLALFFTPGQPVFEGFARISPSWEGVELMLERGMLLLTLALLATAFIFHYKPAEIVGAIQLLVRFLPHRYANRLAMRIYLVLEEFPAVEERVRAARTTRTSESGEQGFMSAAVAIITDIESCVFEPGRGEIEGGLVEQQPRRFADKVLSLLLPMSLLCLFVALAAFGY